MGYNLDDNYLAADRRLFFFFFTRSAYVKPCMIFDFYKNFFLLNHHLLCFLINLDKRRASMDNLMQQRPLKKIASEGTMGAVPMSSMQVDVQGTTGGYSTAVGASSVGLSSMTRQLPTENIPGREVGGRAVKVSNILAQAWKEDMDAGHLVAPLFELFGESLFSFTPKPELSFFL